MNAKSKKLADDAGTEELGLDGEGERKSEFEDEPGNDPSKNKERPRYLAEVKDIQKTGSWGAVSQKEKTISIVVVALIAIGAVVAVAVIFAGGGESSEDGLILAPTSAPTGRPPTTNEQQWSNLISSIKNHSLLQNSPSSLEWINEPMSFLEGKASNEDTSPQIRAASWLIFEDERDEHHDSVFLKWRYALATLFYALGGSDWTRSSGWMTPRETCEWHGVSCNFPNLDKIVTLDLADNNLSGGPLPPEISVLDELISLFLGENHITGEFPNQAVGSIPTLLYLYVNNNEFTGQISTDLRANGILHTLYIQENNFTGIFPIEFCPTPGEGFKLLEFGLDCDELQCYCCDVSPAVNIAFDPCF